MKTVSIRAIRMAAVNRPSGYTEDVLSRGVIKDGNILLSDSDYLDLAHKYRPHGPGGVRGDIAREPRPDGGAPTLFRKAANFAAAAARHVAAGAPLCTQAQIDARLTICKSCEFLKDNACTKCGCPVKRERAYLSKLAWADQSCPVGKWGPEDTSK